MAARRSHVVGRLEERAKIHFSVSVVCLLSTQKKRCEDVLAKEFRMNLSVLVTPAAEADVPAIFRLICKLAEYEHLSHEVTATEALVRQHLFGPKPAAEAILAKRDGQPVGFALFFTTYSTFVGRPG